MQLAIRNWKMGSDHSRPMGVWDGCAGSGGKSILLYDMVPGVDLTVSDIRESILINLKKRFTKAGIPVDKKRVINLSSPPPGGIPGPFDLVICDAPCTGSGTWGRTPEQLFYFNPVEIGQYAALQKKILSGLIPQVKPGACLLYSTCSVFTKENEEAVGFLKEQFHLHLVKMELLVALAKNRDAEDV